MISCTEFIPLYSEFFKYLEKRGGHDAVVEYWRYISDTFIGDVTNPTSLAYKCERFGGFEGALAYWGHTLTEEACDLFDMVDKNARVRYMHMRHCPSRGMLNSLQHIEPYYDYCSHCDLIYSRVLEKYGVVYERDKSGIEHAECRDIVYEKGNPPAFDFRTVKDEELKARAGEDGVSLIDMKSEDNKYLHRDFHTSMDNALQYCADRFGVDALEGFLREYVRGFYAPVIKEIRENGLEALKAWIEETYRKEEASSLMSAEISPNKLVVTVERCPAIAYMRSLGHAPGACFIEETRTVYDEIAKQCGYRFHLEYYNQDGGTKFEFDCQE